MASPPPLKRLRRPGGESTVSTKWQDEEEVARQQANIPKKTISPIQVDHQAPFYTEYRKVADEYDKEFLKKYDEDLNTTLIFAGLFSAVASAFIIEVNSQLQPDSGDETAALLRVLIYQMNRTAFGDDVPTPLQWTGPPPTAVHVQAILFASLAVSLLSAFLAMLGKQWLNRYVSTDKRGSAVERSQNRQRKLDGVIAWYFDHVMESLPMMLQVALLLLGSALSRYLWDISITVAAVVIGVTSFGVVFFLFIVIAGAASDSCPYQTPGSNILRNLGPNVWKTIRSIGSYLRGAFNQSQVTKIVAENAGVYHPWWSRSEIIPFFMDLVLEVPRGVAIDIYHLGRAAIRPLSTIPVGAYHLVHGANSRLHSTYSTLEQQVAPSHFRCISWTLQTSLDKPIHLTTLEYLEATTELTGIDPTIVMDCFNVLVGCMSFDNQRLVVMKGLEQLSTVSARCFSRTFHHLSVTDPTSSVLADIRERYNTVFPFDTHFKGLPFYHTITIIHALAHKPWNLSGPWWDDCKASGQDNIQFARDMVKVALVEYERVQHTKVPRWILRFALDCLSLDAPPPVSVLADCLTIVAIDLGCNVSYIMTPEASVGITAVLDTIGRELQQMATADSYSILSKRKALSALFSYAIRQEQDGEQWMANAILHVASASESRTFVWHRIGPHILRLFGKSSTPSLQYAIPLIFPQIPWDSGLREGNKVIGWEVAVDGGFYLEEETAGQAEEDVVNLLLQIAHFDSLLPHIPVDIWAWLKRRPSLPPVCQGRSRGTTPEIVRHIRGLGDFEILKSYFLVIWSEWDSVYPSGLNEMEISMREDFGGTWKRNDRKHLVGHLEHVLERLGYIRKDNPQVHENRIQLRKEQYEKLKRVLLEIDGEQ